jgi:ABC-type transport system involved in cytochrome c biogenesis permease subunit
MHVRVVAAWRGSRLALVSIAGFGVILFNIFVVNFVLSGLHSYAGA